MRSFLSPQTPYHLRKELKEMMHLERVLDVNLPGRACVAWRQLQRAKVRAIIL